MKSALVIVLTILASAASAQNVDPIVFQRNLNLGANNCPELSIGPSFLAPWFPWSPNCFLIHAWISWYPFPPRICYIYRCPYAYYGQFFFVYFKICRRMFFRNGWQLDNAQIDNNNFRNVDNTSSFVASTNLNDLLEGQSVMSERPLDCSYIANLSNQAQASRLGARY